MNTYLLSLTNIKAILSRSLDLFYRYLVSFLDLFQARSERGSRRLPHERSSEISKKCHKNSDSHSPIYMCVEINRAGVFGPKIFPFRRLTCDSHFPIYMHVEINQAGVFGPIISHFVR